MIKVLEVTKNPISYIGEVAGECWGSPIDNQEKNYKRGLDCLEANHGRTLEYPDITIKMNGYSARCQRELYTHIIGTSRLQGSTRYINYKNFKFYIPNSIKQNDSAFIEYTNCMNDIMKSYDKLLKLGIPKEDIANILPLGMDTTVVLKINLRALIHFMQVRMCSRAYAEIRQLCKDIKAELSQIDNEWKYVCDNYFIPKCKADGYCIETYSCGLMPKKGE